MAVLLAVAVARAHTVVKRQIEPTGVDGVVENLAAAVDALQAQVTELTDRLSRSSSFHRERERERERENTKS